MIIEGENIKVLTILADKLPRGIEVSFSISVNEHELMFYFVKTSNRKFKILFEQMEQTWLKKKTFDKIEL